MEKKKICMIGNFGVGKTSLVERFVHNQFSDTYLTTIGVKISQKVMPPISISPKESPVQFTFMLWDIAALDKFDTMAQNYYRGAAGALAVCDLTRLETVEQINELCRDFRSVNEQSKFVFVGNKTDLCDPDSEMITRLADIAGRHNSRHLLTSAKTGSNVEACFNMLAQQLITQK